MLAGRRERRRAGWDPVLWLERRRGIFFEARGAKFFLEGRSEAGEPGEGQCGCGMLVSGHMYSASGGEKMVGWPCSSCECALVEASLEPPAALLERGWEHTSSLPRRGLYRPPAASPEARLGVQNLPNRQDPPSLQPAFLGSSLRALLQPPLLLPLGSSITTTS